MKSFFLVCYDISDPKRLQKIAKVMKDFGVRVLYSVFECWLTFSEFEAMKIEVESLMDPLEDKVRYYRLCESCSKPVIHLGYGKFAGASDEDTLVI